jgi:hypothetical protein
MQTQSFSQTRTIQTKKPVKTPEIEPKLNTKLLIPETMMVKIPLTTVATITGLDEHPDGETQPVTVTEETQQPVLVTEPRTVIEHADWMRQTGRARVLTGDGTIYGDYSLPEMHGILPKLKGDFAGVIIDETVNQRFVDTAAEIGMKFVVAKSFEGVIRRPVSIRMISL